MKNFLTILVAVVVISCNKKVSELPPATDKGANTFGARVKGKFWVPKGFGIMPTASILEARYEPGRNIVINARNFAASPNESEFEIYLFNVRTTGTYLLNANTGKYPNQSGNYAYYVERKIRPINEWITNTQYTGVVNITKADTVNRIIAGTFEFEAINMEEGNAQPLSVTEGRFDIKIP